LVPPNVSYGLKLRSVFQKREREREREREKKKRENVEGWRNVSCEGKETEGLFFRKSKLARVLTIRKGGLIS